MKRYTIFSFACLSFFSLVFTTIIISNIGSRDINNFRKYSYFDEDFSWLSINLETEFGKLANAILIKRQDASIGDGKSNLSDAVDFRMSIVLSRFEVLTKGQFAEWASINPETMDLIKKIENTTEEIYLLIKTKKFTDDSLSFLINDAHSHTRSLTMQALSLERDKKEFLLSELDGQHDIAMYMSYLSVVVFFIATTMIVIQWRKRDSQDIELHGYSEKLKRSILNYKYFIRVTSHEIRNSAQVINAMVERDSTFEEGKISASTLKSLKHFNDNINSLLDFARALSNFSNFYRENIKIKETVRMWTEATLFNSKIKYEIISEETQDYISIHRTVLFRVFSNILINAEKYAKKKVIVYVSINAKKKEIKIGVKDDGDGFLPEALEAFASGQPNDRSTADLNGMGIGLMVSKQILEKIGGKIEITNCVYGGALVNLTLPFMNATTEEYFDKTVECIGLHRPEKSIKNLILPQSILYCEDNSDVFEATISLLKNTYPIVFGAQNIEDCISFLEKQNVDLILIDYNLGKNSARDVISVLKNKNQNTKVILITGVNKSHIVDVDWADDVILKPVSFENIKTSIRNLFEINDK